MRICIHRGTREIGGTCVEIESQGKRLVLDVGLPLDCLDRIEVYRGTVPVGFGGGGIGGVVNLVTRPPSAELLAL